MRVMVAIRGRRERKCCVCDENDDVDAIWRLRGKLVCEGVVDMVVGASTLVLCGLVGYFVKISKEGKRHDRVRKEYESKCPLTASESEELLSSNHIKYCECIELT